MPLSVMSSDVPTRKARASSDFPRGPLLILWGSQTGTAEAFSNELLREARRRGYNAKSVDLEEYSGDELAEEQAPVLMLMSTHGEGEPTDNAVEFYNWANNEARSPTDLSALKFAAFALGNTQYEHYCFMGRWAQRRLTELGQRVPASASSSAALRCVLQWSPSERPLRPSNCARQGSSRAFCSSAPLLLCSSAPLLLCSSACLRIGHA